MKPFVKTLIVSLTAIMMVACSKQGPQDQKNAEQASAAVAGGKPVIGLAISTLNNPFFVSLKKGAEDEANKLGVQLINVDAQDDPAKQQASVEDLIQKKVNVILINPTDSAAVSNVVKEAQSKGIKVISLDRSVEGATVDAHIASDNVDGGKMAAEFLLKKLGDKANLVELEGVPGSSAARERGQGFHAIIDGKSGVKVLAKQTANFDRSQGLSVMENILQAHPNVQGVFAQNDEMALGALKAIQAAGLKNVLVVGFDATADAVASVKAKQMAATVEQQPELIGQYGVQTAQKLLEGQHVDKFIPVPLKLITQ